MPGRTRIQFRRDNAAQWTSNNPTLASGELGYEEDTGKFKIGNGTTQWNDLDYAVNNAGSPVDPESLAAHEIDTTNVHGITNTSNLVLTNDSRLSDSRTPTAHKSTHATGGTDALSASDIGAAASNHNHSETYDPLGTASSLITTHEAASDPHPTYLTATEGNAAYDALGSAASAVSTHTAASDPHGDRAYVSSNYVLNNSSNAFTAGSISVTNVTASGTASANTVIISGGTVGVLTTTTPSALGTAAVGTLTTAARADHVHGTAGIVTTVDGASGAITLSGTYAARNSSNGFTAGAISVTSVTASGTASASLFTGATLNLTGTSTTSLASANTFTGATLNLTGTASAALFTGATLNLTGTSTTSLASAATFTGATLNLTGTATSTLFSAPTFTGATLNLSGTANASLFTGATLNLSGTASAPTFTGATLNLSGTATAAIITSSGELSAKNLKVNVGTTTAALDFTAEGYKTLSTAASVTFTASGYASGRTITSRVTNSAASSITVAFPSTWVFVGTKPTSLAASKVGILTVTSFGTTEADCVAAWAVQA